MFSDILTPLVAMGVEFDVVKGKGPVIGNPIRTAEDVAAVQVLGDIEEKLSFVGQTLQVRDKDQATLVLWRSVNWHHAQIRVGLHAISTNF